MEDSCSPSWCTLLPSWLLKPHAPFCAVVIRLRKRVDRCLFNCGYFWHCGLIRKWKKKKILKTHLYTLICCLKMFKSVYKYTTSHENHEYFHHISHLMLLFCDGNDRGENHIWNISEMKWLPFHSISNSIACTASFIASILCILDTHWKYYFQSLCIISQSRWKM